MGKLSVILGATLLISVTDMAVSQDLIQRLFPDSLEFGAATASYQVEGAWDEDGKSMNVWDFYTHKNPCVIDDCSNGDVATDSYHQVERDVEMMRELGLKFYRFSISWSRLLPSGFANEVNPAGVAYYNKLINEMLKYDIEPMVTLFHWDLPQRLQELGGFANPLIVQWFADYARVCYEQFGDRVKTWITFNEPKQICFDGYGSATTIPQLDIGGYGDYLCAKYLLLSHAAAWHIYDEDFRPTQQGENAITVNAEWFEPLTDSEEDIAAAAEFAQFEWGIYFHPIYSETGDFPEIVKEKVALKSAQQGFPRSRLPALTQEEIDHIKGTGDFLGLNHYSTKFIYRNESTLNNYKEPSMRNDVGAEEFPQGSMLNMQVIPWGFNKIITHLSETYNKPLIYITENGYAGFKGLNDDDRVDFMRTYLAALIDAIENGANVIKYAFWSLIDNFEWMRGYTAQFGLYEVDFQDPGRKRTARKSALVYKNIISSRQIDFSYEPETLDISFD